MFSLPKEASELPSFALIRRSRSDILLAVILVLLLITVGAALRFTPWLQSVTAQGKVTYYNPMDRPQEVDAQIAGRVVKWYINEGESVRKGQKLALLQDIDPKYLAPNQVLRMRQMVSAYDRKVDAARLRLGTIQDQLAALGQVRVAALPAANQRLRQSQQRRLQAQQLITQYRQNLDTDHKQFDRMKYLTQEGLRSQRDHELAEQSLVRSRTELERGQQSLEVAARDIDIARLEANRLAASLDSDQAKLQESYLKAQETLAEAEAERTKLQLELGHVEQRRAQQVVQAPCDGQLVRVVKLGGGETVKSGDTLCRIVPRATLQAVELYVSGFDAPLVRRGLKVRLMFDGFPAVPFTAWPWAAVGTFGGTVQTVDAADDGKSRYRVLVVPDLQPGDSVWPQPEEDKAHQGFALRPGTQAQGWIMMGAPVPLYREVWRRLNAFPPVPSETKEESLKDYQAKPVLKR